MPPRADHELPAAFRWAAIAVCGLVIAIFTLLPHRGTSGPLDSQLVPMESLVHLVRHTSRRTVLTNVVGNLLLFAPLAVLLRLLITRSAARALLGVLLASVFVEVVQGVGWTDGRQANIDDVILNVLGAAIALLVLHLGRDTSPPVKS
jgi:glycopeptide antibiotics resistance protein